MNLSKVATAVLTVILILFGNDLSAQRQLAPELNPDQRRAVERRESERLAKLTATATLPTDIAADANSSCGNGDFEGSLDAAEWSGGHGIVNSAGDPNFAFFTPGLIPGTGLKTDPGSHQTWVGVGTDTFGTGSISQVAPVGLSGTPGTSTRAVRIGNAINGAGSELLSKTFTVSASQSVIRFWYAVVFEDPGHDRLHQPSFWVRVLDSSGNVIPGAANLGNSSDKVVADGGNPFFRKATVHQPDDVVYRDWTCAEINLAAHVGKTVTIQFVTEDCALGGHYGYAYVDNFCGLCVGGADGVIKLGRSTDCGRGQICFDYTLPAAGSLTGSITIKLDILQNGVVVSSLSSPTLTTGTSHCFNIDPSAITGLSTSAGGFDFAATAAFQIGSTVLAPKTAGVAPDGTITGKNNDYKITCEAGCCPGTNLIKNGDFEAGNTDFTSGYAFAAGPYTAGAVLPDQYAVLNATQASAVASTWNAVSPTACSATGKYLAVNGATGQTGSKMVWSQTVAVVPGKEYRFCARFRNLPQCAFDVKPKIELKFSSPPNSTASSVISTTSNSCDWVLETRTILIPSSTVLLTAEIWLDQTAAGDGNDLAVDDISLQEMQPANPMFTQVNISSSSMSPTDYALSATPANGQPYSFYWEVCELNTSGNCIAATQVSNPMSWWTPGTNDFKGYQAGSFNPISTTPGRFTIGKQYMIKYGVFDRCISWTESRWYFMFAQGRRDVIVARTLRELNQ